ncbi:MAG: hypothetical protein EA375_05330 [Acholeplasmataceae bacterium]|nr:MAG: hypothetical protein EA375_05330 [Acholeplasmataceae bacterium]
MRKLIIILLLTGLFLGTFTVRAIEPVTIATNTATQYLKPRPGSSRTPWTLTLSQLNSWRSNVRNTVTNANTQMRDIDFATLDARLDVVDAALSGVTTAMFNADPDYYYDLYEELFSIYGATIESRAVDGRGMWHRPFERNLNEVRATLQEMVDMGINMLYVETFWLGRLIYDSNIPGTFQHGFTTQQGYGDYGTNLLLAFVEEGKHYGVEVHAWVENFFVGFGSSHFDSPILANRPEWASINFDGSIPQRSEVNYLFMDPANPEVRRYLKEIYAEIVMTTDVASIHLDYIRYPVAKHVRSPNPVNNLDTGYSDFAEAEFKFIHGLTGDLRTLVVENATIANLWKQYKTGVISRFVAGVYHTVKNVNPEVVLSTAIFGNVQNAIDEKMQDWNSWIQDGYIDIIMPMSYYQSSLTVGSEVDRLTQLVGLNAFSYAGLAPTYMGFNAHYNTTQVQASLANRAQGTAMFASQFYMLYRNDYQPINKGAYALEVQRVLTDGVYRKPAVLPHAPVDIVIDAMFDDMLDKAERIYVARGAMTAGQYAALAAEFNRLSSLPHDSDTALEALIADIRTLSGATYANIPASLRINEDIAYLSRILDIKLERIGLDDAIDLTVNPDPDTFDEGVELTAPANLRIEGDVLQWDGVAHALRYQLVATLGDETVTLNIQGTSFDLLSLKIGSYSFRLRAVGDGYFYLDSALSESVGHVVSAIQLITPANVRVENNKVFFDPVPMAVEYEIIINQTEFIVNEAMFDLAPYNLPPGQYVITVRARGNNGAILSSSYSEPYLHTVTRQMTEAESTIYQMAREDLKAFLLWWMRRD